MVYFVLVQLLIFSGLSAGAEKIDRVLTESYLGEKRLDAYAGRGQPLIFQDVYQGKMAFQDELFWNNYFQNYLFSKERDYGFFLKSELGSGMTCPNEQLSDHFDDIRYSYRLITLSYLLEGQWHLNMLSKHLHQLKGCKFNFAQWIDSCRPKSEEMKKFVSLVKKHNPKYEETLPKTYIKGDWWRDFSKKNFKYYSHYRLDTHCKGGCKEADLEANLMAVCQEDEKLMTLICSEQDELYGLSESRDAYHLLGLSNIINTYNKHGEAVGCLRRFSEVMSHKEVKYPALATLFPPLRTHLQRQYKERFLQGRVFFYGSGKEFEEKGLSNLYVMEQPLKIEELTQEEPLPTPEPPKVVAKSPEPQVKKEPKKEKVPEKKPVVEVPKPVKSAFLQAAEIRKAQDLEMVEVDMLKFKYDYVFTLNMINKLSDRLKTFMGREALAEMMTYDKLGTKEGPVPLLFIKFMIDMQEHTGLFNLINVLGEEFFVSNEIDSQFKPEIERVRLMNSEATGRQWQLYIVRP